MWLKRTKSVIGDDGSLVQGHITAPNALRVGRILLDNRAEVNQNLYIKQPLLCMQDSAKMFFRESEAG